MQEYIRALIRFVRYTLILLIDILLKLTRGKELAKLKNIKKQIGKFKKKDEVWVLYCPET